MSRRNNAAGATRKRAASRLRKLRALLKGTPSALDALLEERRRKLRNEETRPKAQEHKSF